VSALDRRPTKATWNASCDTMNVTAAAAVGAAALMLAMMGLATGQQQDVASDVDAYHRDGFLIKRAMLSSEEMALIRAALETDESLDRHAVRNTDSAGGFSQVTLLAPLSTSKLGTILRLARFVRLLRALLGDPMQWMTRIVHKMPHGGGEWTWHQDYGYWRQDGFRRPDMMTMYIAVDDQTAENGPLRLLKGSHRVGLAEHATQGSASRGVDSEQLHDVMRRFPEESPLLRSGDVIFIHALLYHASSGNASPLHRRALTAVYTRADNVGGDGSCCQRVDELSDDALKAQDAAVVALDAASLRAPWGYVGAADRLRHGYEPQQ